jgi:hypothetical protein
MPGVRNRGVPPHQPIRATGAVVDHWRNLRWHADDFLDTPIEIAPRWRVHEERDLRGQRIARQTPHQSRGNSCLHSIGIHNQEVGLLAHRNIVDSVPPAADHHPVVFALELLGLTGTPQPSASTSAMTWRIVAIRRATDGSTLPHAASRSSIRNGFVAEALHTRWPPSPRRSRPPPRSVT